MDEPTASLDQTLESTLVSRLETWLQGRTAVIATHRVPILKLTERTLILQNGRMAVDGPRDQVLAHLNSKNDHAPGVAARQTVGVSFCDSWMHCEARTGLANRLRIKARRIIAALLSLWARR